MDTEDAISQKVERCALGPGWLAHPIHCAVSDHHGQDNLGTPVSLNDAACPCSHPWPHLLAVPFTLLTPWGCPLNAPALWSFSVFPYAPLCLCSCCSSYSRLPPRALDPPSVFPLGQYSGSHLTWIQAVKWTHTTGVGRVLGKIAFILKKKKKYIYIHIYI